jgi:hypothetical protein
MSFIKTSLVILNLKVLSLILLIILCLFYSACHDTGFGGFSPIADEYYSYTNALTDSVILIDESSRIHYLLNKKRVTIRTNCVEEYIEHAVYYEGEEFYTYFESEEISLTIKLTQFCGYQFGAMPAEYFFSINHEDSIYFGFDFGDEFMNNQIVEITGAGFNSNYAGPHYSNKLFIQKYLGIIALHTFRGDTFYVAGLPEEYYPD